MDFYDFLDLSSQGKAHSVQKYGVFLIDRKVDLYTYKLFAINDFYVELLHDENNQLVGDINAFESMEFLDLYLDTISLAELQVILK